MLVWLVAVDCIKQSDRPSSSGNNRTELAATTPTPTTAPVVKETEIPPVPLAFKSIDFKNLSYQTNLRGRITLKDGSHEIENSEGGGGDTFELRDVYYTDITGDHKEEAVVHLFVWSCGGSCDGGSHLFYFYSAAQDKPRLLSRFETGSLAYGECGLKSFVLTDGMLALELFQTCRRSGLTFQPSKYDSNYRGGKFEAQSFTRFLFQFGGRGFSLKKREVFPFPQGDVKNYPETITINRN
jgi:hypothetical protein